MMRFGTLVLACVVSLVAWPCVAKNDIRGVATAQGLADALETLEFDGATCAPPARAVPTVCTYDERTRMTVYAAAAPPNKVEKLVYTFHFVDIAKMRDKLQLLYGLRRDRIEGEHTLFTGERLDIELQLDGTGSLSITNDMQARKNRAAEAR